MFGVGIIGAGWFGSEHAKALSSVAEARLVAVCGAKLESAQAFAQRYGGRAFSAPEELLADPEVDVVLIATPHHLHADLAIQAAQRGKHILLEKPMAPSLEECDRILAAVHQAGVKLMLGHLSHFERPFVRAKEILQSGELGEPVLGHSTFAKFWMEHNRRPWHLDRGTGGGMMLTAGIHGLDRLMWLIGSRVSSVAAQFGTHFHAQQADDTGALFLRFTSGAAGTLSSVGYAQGAPSFALEITATRGRLHVDPTRGVFVGRNQVWREVPDSLETQWPQKPLIAEWNSFIQAIQNNQEPAVGGSYARHLMQVIFSAEESSKTRREIVLEARS
ncbi:Gfo/Idh/MocA family protein [Calidithermus timidus]|uniref:Gfo/Idh/MocA family protein n=1 Tax=Calidithermus timidus TaxID=307124 RepID=UPI00036D7FD6|nr:Gfo/Idh/MocA family oxidoreductase [Calidithermus timidus]